MGIGTSIVTRAGPSVKLERVEAQTAQTTVYNFEVEDFHTYFVGQNGLWVHNECGSYTITFRSGKKYHGKGPRKRSRASARREAAANSDSFDPSDIDWVESANNRQSFIDEARRIRADGGIANPDNYNRISSPGERILREIENAISGQ